MSRHQKKKTSSISQMRLVSLVGLTISLFVLGLIALLRIGSHGLQHKINEQFCVTASVPRRFTPEQNTQLERYLETRPEVVSSRYISQAEAAEEIAQSIGQSVEEMLAPIGENPFDPIYEIHIASDYIHTDSLNQLKQDLVNQGLEVDLNYKTDLLASLVKNTRIIEWVSWAILLALVILCYIQMTNTIRMFIYADRISIRILTLVGAKPWFIRTPIVGKAVLDGIIAACISIGLLSGIIYLLQQLLRMNLLSILPTKHLLFGAIGLVTIAIVSTALSAWSSTQRYIRMNSGLIHID